ncbi:ABC transporter ATP-binding protein [Methylocella silvestris]|uniref:ABC transporter n=1 Tax=Methylocella silvestris TaxID=199596 RepID=A0A2J7TJ85_METSI|nr:ABC transporter ATP-binding protein [Methylocella silvestris]PNG26816.1 ABC transporter [Methylocella silvestris]
MSSELVISCSHVGKAYQLYIHRNDQLKQALFGRWKQFYRQHWVLKDVSFKVHQGERVGIIGRNGAGKTTLLQIICGITRPTIGSVTVSGRVAPILALGSGFDLELTGRENALIGGAILGVKRSVIEARLSDVAAFADIGDFFYQPLKMYSTGMAARLAFAVCAYADADILIVDEALSVGDGAFQAKCDAFIQDFAKKGTILVVSHDMKMLSHLCDRVIWIDDGAVRDLGAPEDIIDDYLHEIDGRPRAVKVASA